jgi:hypothetical protein
MKAAFNNKLPNQTEDVIVNLRNPDSKPHAAAHSISNHHLNLLDIQRQKGVSLENDKIL